jgi:hypothetical protein
MKIALLSPIAWRTPPRHYGPWERVVSLLSYLFPAAIHILPLIKGKVTEANSRYVAAPLTQPNLRIFCLGS